MGISVKRFLLGITILGAVSLIGCGEPKDTAGPTLTVESTKDIHEAIAALEAHRANVIPTSASGDLQLIYYKDGKAKEENLNATLRFAPPRQLYFSSSSIVGEAIRLGSNNSEFWFQMKPKEISEYFHGTWSQLDGCASTLLISPESILDALGMVRVDPSWLLIPFKGQDVLVKRDENGLDIKKIFVDRSGYLVSKIVYYNKEGAITVTVNMSDYRPVGEGSPIPARMEITTYKSDQVSSEITIKLKSPKFLKPAKIKKKTFARPEPKGFKYVYKMTNDCEFERQ